MADTLNIEEALIFARKLADLARSATLPYFRNSTPVESKNTNYGDFDPVTAADRGAEEAMRKLLNQERPEDGIIGEEFGEKPTQSGWTWLLDPVDGTRAFVAGLPVWTTLIALCDDAGDPIIGLIDQPFLGERYLGWPGGAVLETPKGSNPLQVSNCSDLRLSTIATTDPFILTPSEQGAWTHLRHTARLVRYGLDAYAYARLADGTIDLVAETGLAPWDTGAIIPVIRGAGGLACDWQGRPARPGGQIVCACNDSVLEQALISLRRSAL